MKTRLAVAFAAALALGTARLSLADEPGRASGAEQAQGIQPKSDSRGGDMSGMQGISGMHGGMMGGMGCCSQMAKSEVTVQDTPDGATLRFKAKDRADVQRVQRMAHMMESCMGSGDAGGAAHSK